MSLLVLGINHTSAPIEVREKLAIGDRELPRALQALTRLPDVREGALLSTCNRTEAYAVASPDAGPPEDALAEFLAGWHGLSRSEFDVTSTATERARRRTISSRSPPAWTR